MNILTPEKFNKLVICENIRNIPNAKAIFNVVDLDTLGLEKVTTDKADGRIDFEEYFADVGEEWVAGAHVVDRKLAVKVEYTYLKNRLKKNKIFYLLDGNVATTKEAFHLYPKRERDTLVDVSNNDDWEVYEPEGAFSSLNNINFYSHKLTHEIKMFKM